MTTKAQKLSAASRKGWRTRRKMKEERKHQKRLEWPLLVGVQLVAMPLEDRSADLLPPNPFLEIV